MRAFSPHTGGRYTSDKKGTASTGQAFQVREDRTMEYEIADRPELGQDDMYELFAARHPHRPMPAPFMAPRRAAKRDHAVAIPEQEVGS